MWERRWGRQKYIFLKGGDSVCVDARGGGDGGQRGKRSAMRISVRRRRVSMPNRKR
jgi:hypothetical protein